MSKRIFFGLSGGMGPVLRTLPIAEQHNKVGDTVAFSIYDEHAAKYLMSHGYTYLADDDPLMPDPSLTVPIGPTFYHLDQYFAGHGLGDPLFVRSWIHHRIAMLKEFAPDLVYADMSPHTVIAARYLGIPVAGIVQACFHPNGRPLHYWVHPPRNITRVSSVISNVLQELSLPAIDRMEQLVIGDIAIVPSIPELDVIRGEDVHYVGPIGQYMHDNAPEPAEEYPDVIVYAGRLFDSSGDCGLQLVRLVQAAFRNRPEKVAIVYTGKLPTAEAKAMPPSIVRIERFEQSWLSRVKLYIHHGGHGSCLSSIMQAIPSLVIPTHSEREYNARCLWELGGCEYIMPDTCTPGHFYALARHVMEDHYRSQIAQLRDTVIDRRYGGAAQAYRLGCALMNQRIGGNK
ncbi:glycosyltransferase [Paenibacillus kobensis]|uniref:glycosyltransferase n=1 Tax=Paenibacillus kobensis TaxID=59841 RepID=UPI000FDB5B77|nr:nucleotide disphospho-sugar-binding domain-containing protein [Paenibacillus kobensis]